MSETYKIVFRGDIATGHNAVEVRGRLRDIFRLDEEGISKLFSGRPVTIKRNLSAAGAKVWCDTLLKAGAVVQSVSGDDGEPAQATASDPEVPEGLAVEPVGADVLKPAERGYVQPVQINTAHLSVEAPGADVLRPDERSQVDDLVLDLSHLSLEKSP